MLKMSLKQNKRGNALVKFILLILLLAGVGIAIDYRFGTPGATVIDRLRAKAVVADLDLFSGNADQHEIKQTYHYLDHTCRADNSPLGDSVCWATISTFNGIDARIIAFFFRNDKLSAVRVSFAAKNHPELFSLLQKRYGQERLFGLHADTYGNNIVGWIRPSGIVAVNDHVEGEQESILLWLSPSKIALATLGIDPTGY